MHRRTSTVLLATALAILALGGVGSVAAAADSPATAPTALKPGDVLDSSNWELAKDLLPPEVLDHYRTGEYTNPIVDWPADVYTWPPDFRAGSEKNAGQFDVGADGGIIEKGSGKQPEYVLGFPFPIIDAADPNAGVKVVWNYLYRTWYFGTVHAESQLNFMNPDGLDRRVDVEIRYMNYDGVPADDKTPNPQNLLTQSLAVLTSPSDVSGTAALTWRYRDPDKRDSAWSYVPALRRVRQVSPANRSDGFFGSDLAQDDGPFFDGKPEDFTWKLTGEVEQLRYVDPLSLAGKANVEWLGGVKGWKSIWPDIHFLGYMDPAWKGIAWAPVTPVLAKRRFYVVEGVPKDRYYLFGKIQMYLDTIAFQGAWNRKFNWQDELLITSQVMAWMPYKAVRPDGTVDYIQGSNMAFQCSENIKMRRATVAGIKASPNSVYGAKMKFDPQVFVLDSLSRYGK
jgi:hypothetical protein